jgi:hypothetical protein
MCDLQKKIGLKSLAVFIITTEVLFFCTAENNVDNQLTQAEKQAGWKLLFDGKSFNGWRGLGRDTIPKFHWVIENGAIKKVANANVPKNENGKPLPGGDLMTEESFKNLEFCVEWKVASGSNSGIKYNVSEELSTTYGGKYSALGFEYQIIDDDGFPSELHPAQRTGALYDLMPPNTNACRPVGEYNQTKILFQGNHGEHWLNGAKLLEFDLGSAKLDSLIAASKFHQFPWFGEKRTGHIVLQDHGGEVWYHNIKIKELE